MREVVEDGEALLATDVEATDFSGTSKNSTLGFVTGTILRKKMVTFERIVWRALRGNMYMNYNEIDELVGDVSTVSTRNSHVKLSQLSFQGEMVEKSVFIIFAHGRETLAKVKRICESLGATIYAVDESAEKRREQAQEVMGKIEDVNSVGLCVPQTVC